MSDNPSPPTTGRTYKLGIKEWGPSGWNLMQAIAFTFPSDATKDEREIYEKWFTLLGEILPCPSCRMHWKENLKRNPINLNGPEELARWVYDAHNKVRKFQGKEIISFDDIVDEYMTPEMWTVLKSGITRPDSVERSTLQSCGINKNINWIAPCILGIFLLLALIIIVILLLRKK